MPFEETGPSREPIERVAEHEDQLAEAQVLGDRDIQSAKERIISRFDTSTATLTELHALVPQLRTAMDDLIQKTVIRLVNVRDVKDLPPDRLAEIKEVIELRLEEFRKAVEQEAPKAPEQAVALAKGKKASWFVERIAVARETQNDAEFKFTTTPTAVTIEYAEQNPTRPKVTLTVTTNERFFKSPSKTTQGTAAACIKENKESGAYRIEGTNDRIQNPKEFKEWIAQQLQSLNVNPQTASAEQLMLAATEIVRKNLKIITDPKKGFENLPQDQMPVDQLLQTQQEGCCRHFTVATRVVFEQIHRGDIVAFENDMSEMGHATLALARGNEITTIDPFWYASGIQETADSTFDGRHGNITSLYRTLSKRTEGNPTGNLFDLGSFEKLARQLHGNDGQIPEEMRDNIDNPEQAVLMRAREVIINEALQTPANLIATIRSLRVIISTLNPEEPEDALALESIKQLAPLLAEAIELRKNGTDQPAEFREAEFLLRVGLQSSLERRTTGVATEAQDEELIRTCEEAVRDQQMEQTARQEIFQIAAEEMLSNVWRGIREGLTKAKEIGQDGLYDIERKTEDAKKTILEPTSQWVDKVVGFIKDKGLDKNAPSIREDLQLKSAELERVQRRVPGTFAERMAATLQEKFKVT